ncbi:hypothetical protein ACF07Y_36990 [Streptomyces sp. NPDC016566]|uniref:hypothetical protein n=1 Tax=Streptomyces sp. NPDC016566 TaxID=3364967 RepID=UPI0036FC8FED
MPEAVPRAGHAMGTTPGTTELHQIGPHLVVAPASALQGPLMKYVAELPSDPRTLIVLAAAPDAAFALRAQLPLIRAITRARNIETVVLAASGLATPDQDGRLPAENLAAELEVPVAAPDGLVSVLSGGRIRVNAPDAAGNTPHGLTPSWWLCEPHRPPRRLGAVWPTSAADNEPTPSQSKPKAPTPAVTRSDAPRRAAAGPTSVIELSDGYWITTDSGPSLLPPGAVGAASAGPDALAVIVGSPETPCVHPDRLAEAIDGLAKTTRPVLLSAPWSPPAPLYDMAARLAGRLGQPVKVAPGLPLSGIGGSSPWILDTEGFPTWEPYLTELTAHPGRGRIVPTAWRLPMAEAREEGRAVFTGFADWHRAAFTGFANWQLEAIPCGIWLRPQGGKADGGVRFRAADPRKPLLVVGDESHPVPKEIWDGVEDIIQRLDRRADHPMGLLVPNLDDPDPQAVARFVCRLHDLVWVEPNRPDRAIPVAVAQPRPVLPVSVPATETTRSLPPVAGPESSPRPVPSTLPFAAGPTSTTSPSAPSSGHPSRNVRPDQDVPLSAVAGPESSPSTVPFAAGPTTSPSAPSSGHPSRNVRPIQDVPLPPLPGAPGSGETALTAEPTHKTLDSAGEPSEAEGVAEAPEPAPTSPQTATAATHRVHVFAPETFAGPTRMSTDAERAAFRSLLGSQYVRYASRADQLATRLPGLRSSRDKDITPDLVAALLYCTDAGIPVSRDEVVSLARNGNAGELAPFLACLSSGLLRLPVHHGGVLLDAEADAEELAHYQVGTILVEPAPMVGLPRTDAALDATVEFAVWSTTGRRTSLLGGPWVVFGPGTRFSVVGVEPGSEVSRPTRVLLRDIGASLPSPPQDGRGTDRDRSAQVRLRRWLEQRDSVDPQQRQRVENPERFQLTPGLARVATTRP